MSNRLKGIAIIGMAGRFPGAKSVTQFWQNLCAGVESISRFSDEELVAQGVEPGCLQDPNYVKAGFVLEDIEMFDASFFGYSPREAEILDPQQRVFLECAWEALENAGYDPKLDTNLIGVYAGGNLSTYLLKNLASHPDLLKSLNMQIALGNDKDSISTRVSYKLNLKGPSISVGTACSTSLVAVHLACRGLQSYQCDMALAGGIAIQVPQVEGYFYQAGGMASVDAHTRAFDAKATGGPFGRGAGVVVLKRLEDAVADGDYIYGVIKGSAINNDGAVKVSYTAPSVGGQAEAIAQAQAIASFDPDTITYIETHGTGTALGDPIEIRALEKVFRAGTSKKGFCAIGSVKTNVSHLNTAAGVTSLIKTTLALKHQQIPPSLHFEEPNPEIDFANSPFYVNTQLSAWQTNGTPRRAGVSSFGLGGTNAHVVLEEAPELEQGSSGSAGSPTGAGEQGRNYQLLVLSAKTNSALETATANLINHLQQHPEINLADVAYTLQVGRHAFNHRRTVVCQDIQDAIAALQNPKRVLTSTQETNECPVVFMFTGLGTHYVDMGLELYQFEPTFRQHFDRCCSLFEPILSLNLKEVIYPNSSPKQEANTENSGIDLRQMLGCGTQSSDPATEKLNQTYLTQPALFAIEYALAQLWMSWGIRPMAMIGYSIGEYVAATIAGVLSLEDAITLVAKRAQMIQELPGGAMLAVPLTEQEVQPFLGKKLSLSAVNGSSQCVLAGTTQAVEELARELSAKGLACRQLQTSHAFHSYMMEAIADSFTALVQTTNLKPPQIPYLSNVTGTWITPEQATNPSYWTQHMCQPVRFADGVHQLWTQHSPILLEIGPGQALSSLAIQCLDNVGDANRVILSSLRYAYDRQSDVAFILNTLGQLWLEGIKIDWSGFYAHERRHRLPLPTYPFERQKYWIEPQKLSSAQRNFQPKLTSELWQSLVEAGQLQASAGALEFDDQVYQQKREWLDRLCIAYINLATTHLGAFSNPNKKYSLQELFEQCQIIPRYQELLGRWLEILVEQGHLHQEQGLFIDLLPLSTDYIDKLLPEVRVRCTDILQQIDLLQLYGENMVAILTGEKEPLEFHVSTLLKSGEFSVQELPENRYYNSIMRACVKQVVNSLSPQVNLRVLELGAGTGTATAELLPILPLEQTNYTFTDVGGFFLNAAKKKFSDYPFIDYQLLDIERPPAEQGYKEHSYDLVVAFKVLHVARNIGQTLEHVRSLLAPGGLLLLWETTEARLESEVIDALIMNPIEDSEGDRNMGNPFISKDEWQEELKSHGFVEVTAFSEFAAFREHVIVAQASLSATQEAPTAFTALLHEQKPDKTPKVSLGKKLNIADWFYIPSWKRSLPPQSNSQVKQLESWLVFADEYGLGAKIVKRLELEGHQVITVRVGKQFSSGSELTQEQLSKHIYTIDPQQQDDYNTLLKELHTQNFVPNRIIHLWSVTQSELVDNTVQAFQSLLFLVQALAKQNFTDELQLAVISNNMQAVTGVENFCPEKATILGLVKVIPQEYSNIKCCSIDINIPSPGTWQEEKFVNQLLTELKTNYSDSVIAYRGLERWVQTFESVQLDVNVSEKPKLKEKGIYLITGGIEDIGLVVAEHLAKTVQAKLLILEAEDFPNREEWEEWLTTHDEQDNISRRILKTQELEKLGAEVLIKSVNVLNLTQMQSAIAQTHFGQLNGVFHTAKIPIEKLFTPIAEINPKEYEQQFQQKRQRLLVLEEILQSQKLDFCLLMSSLTSVLGGLGSVGYTAASLLTDAFAYQHNQKNPLPWMSINWDAWQFAAENQQIFTTTTLAEFAIQPQEGINALERILFWSQYYQIVVSTGNLQSRIDQWIKLESLQEKSTNQQVNLSSRHSRPNLKNAYIAPSNDVERKLADIFQELLGIEPIGIHDNFFALGGDSLTGTVLISQVRKHFQVELPVRSLFEAPTVAELALVIEEILIEEIEQLSGNWETDKTFDVQFSN